MTIERLLENLRNQLNSINSAIHAIEEAQRNEQHSVKRAKIISSIRRAKQGYDKKRRIPEPTKDYNGKHWMQQPKNRKKMLKQVKLMQSANRRNQ
jgi:hypothetical protein